MFVIKNQFLPQGFYYYYGIFWISKKSFLLLSTPKSMAKQKSRTMILRPNFETFVNYKQNILARFFLIAVFTYNNTKNMSTNHNFFNFYYSNQLRISYKETINLYFKSKYIN